MKYDECKDCSQFRCEKYPTPYCEKIMMSIADIDVCPKKDTHKRYTKTEAQYQALNINKGYEDLSYSEKLEVGFGILDDES